MASAQPVKVLTIAGSDSGGAAGLQADLKTFTVLGAYGMSAVTVVTAQNSERVAAHQTMPEALVAAQIEAVLEDYGAAAIKTGFLGSAALIQTVAASLADYRGVQGPPLIVDPVLVNHRGQAMFGAEVTDAYRRYLVRGCTMATPNRLEASLLCDRPVETWSDVVDALKTLRAMGAESALVTGVWRGGAFGDVLSAGDGVAFLATEHVRTAHTHGSGDTLSAAITVFLAQGFAAGEAVRQAQAFTAAAIRGAAGWQMGAGHGPLNHMAPWPEAKEE